MTTEAANDRVVKLLPRRGAYRARRLSQTAERTRSMAAITARLSSPSRPQQNAADAIAHDGIRTSGPRGPEPIRDGSKRRDRRRWLMEEARGNAHRARFVRQNVAEQVLGSRTSNLDGASRKCHRRGTTYGVRAMSG